MGTTLLDCLTIVAHWFIAASMLLTLTLLARRRGHNHLKEAPRITLILFILFAITLLANTQYLSNHHTSRKGMLPSERFEIPPPEIYIEHPSAARSGDDVRIVLEALNANFRTDIEASLVDSETGETIGEGSITIEPGRSEVENIIFTMTMPEKDLKVTIRANHPDTLSELRVTITIKKAGLDVAVLLLMGVMTTAPILTLATVRRKG